MTAITRNAVQLPTNNDNKFTLSSLSTHSEKDNDSKTNQNTCK